MTRHGPRRNSTSTAPSLLQIKVRPTTKLIALSIQELDPSAINKCCLPHQNSSHRGPVSVQSPMTLFRPTEPFACESIYHKKVHNTQKKKHTNTLKNLFYVNKAIVFHNLKFKKTGKVPISHSVRRRQPGGMLSWWETAGWLLLLPLTMSLCLLQEPWNRENIPFPLSFSYQVSERVMGWTLVSAHSFLCLCVFWHVLACWCLPFLWLNSREEGALFHHLLGLMSVVWNIVLMVTKLTYYETVP